jgi:hypothetical protein
MKPEIKKPPEGKMEYPSREQKTGPLQIDADVLQELRVYAAINNVGMADTAEKAIRKFIK